MSKIDPTKPCPDYSRPNRIERLVKWAEAIDAKVRQKYVGEIQEQRERAEQAEARLAQRERLWQEQKDRADALQAQLDDAVAQMEQAGWPCRLAEAPALIRKLETRLDAAEQELKKATVAKVIAQQSRALELMSRGPAAVELENNLREQVALTELRAEAAEASLAQIRTQLATIETELLAQAPAIASASQAKRIIISIFAKVMGQ